MCHSRGGFDFHRAAKLVLLKEAQALPRPAVAVDHADALAARLTHLQGDIEIMTHDQRMASSWYSRAFHAPSPRLQFFPTGVAR